MSKDWKKDPEASASTIPLVRKDNLGSFMGTKRLPKTADELGAVAVIDLLFGGRILVWPHSPTHYRVQRLYGAAA